MERVMKASIVTLSGMLLLAALGAMAGGFGSKGGEPAEAPARTCAFSYQVHFPATPGATGPGELWIPTPVFHDTQQDLTAEGDGALEHRVRVVSEAPYALGSDPEYHNRFVVFHPTPQQLAAGFDATMTFTATRREYTVLHGGALVRTTIDGAAEPA
jgi:hypothetical protein